MTWLGRAAEPDGEYDVFVNLSCGTQMHPHLMLDTVVLRSLGVNFAAGAGSAFCCGGYRIHTASAPACRWPTRASGRPSNEGEHPRLVVYAMRQQLHLGVQPAGGRGRRGDPPARDQFLDFLAEQLEELGDSAG